MAANQLIYAMLSHRGRVRRGNEDACAASLDSGAFIVCDGMGGAAGGEVASHLAAETFLAHLTPQTSPTQRPQIRLNSAIQAANRAVYHQATHTPDLAGMGTTLVAILHAPIVPASKITPRRSATNHPNSRATDPPTLWLAHVGDSRCYLLRRNQLQLLTIDHSLVEEQLRAGHITPDQAANSPMRNLITRAIGSQPTVEPEIQSHHPHPGDIYLLASDGLTRELSDPEICHVLVDLPDHPTQAALATACKSLINAANTNGGHDNITVLLIALSPA